MAVRSKQRVQCGVHDPVAWRHKSRALLALPPDRVTIVIACFSHPTIVSTFAFDLVHLSQPAPESKTPEGDCYAL